jgi:hypothetical protein
MEQKYVARKANHVLIEHTFEFVFVKKTDKLIEIGRCYGMEINVKKKTKVKRISRQPLAVKIMIDQK